MKKTLAVLGAAALIGSLAAAPAGATNGMDMVGYSTRSIGMGGADVAVDSDASAVSGNPALISTATPSSATAGATALMPWLDMDVDGAGPTPNVDGNNQLFLMPMLGYAHRLGASPWSVGLGLYAQGGMGVLFEDVPTSPTTADEISSKVAFARLNPVVSYKVSEQLNVGATVMFGYAQAEFAQFANSPGGMEVKDLWSFGFAGKVGAQYKIGDQLRIGATYLTESKVDLDDGTATLNFGSQGGLVEYEAKMEEFTWPQELEFGVAYLPIKGLTIAADVKWINWSATIDQPKLVLSNPPAGFPATPFPSADGTPMSSDTVAFDMGWDDQWVYAIGAEYCINPVHTVRAGVNFANNPVPDDKLNPLFPAIPTTHATVGYGLNLGKWAVDFAWEHAFEKTQQSTNPQMPVEISHSQDTVSLAATYRY